RHAANKTVDERPLTADGYLRSTGRARLPGRGAEDIAEPVAQARRRSEIPSDSEIFVRLQLPDVERIDLLGQPVVWTERLLPEGPEEPVPEDENAAVILVEILGV